MCVCLLTANATLGLTFLLHVAVLMLPSVDAGYNELKAKHGSRMIIGGLDIGQRLSGVSLKLLAFERLLHDYSSWQSRVVMVQRVLLPNSRQSDEANTVRELRCIVKRIQDSFGPQVIDYHGNGRIVHAGGSALGTLEGVGRSHVDTDS